MHWLLPAKLPACCGQGIINSAMEHALRRCETLAGLALPSRRGWETAGGENGA